MWHFPCRPVQTFRSSMLSWEEYYTRSQKIWEHSHIFLKLALKHLFIHFVAFIDTTWPWTPYKVLWMQKWIMYLVILNPSNVLGQGSSIYGLWAKSNSSSVFVNRALVEHCQAHLYTYCLWLLLCYNNRVKKLQERSYDSWSIKYLQSGSSLRNFADSCIRLTMEKIKKKKSLSVFHHW